MKKDEELNYTPGGGFVDHKVLERASAPDKRAWEGSLQPPRHPWNALVGQVAPEVLVYLQGDAGLTGEGLEGFGLQFTDPGENGKEFFRVEQGRKFLTAGRAAECTSGNMCGLKLRNHTPLPRVEHFFDALFAVNRPAFEDIAARSRVHTRRIDDETLGRNGAHFKELKADMWPFKNHELHVMEPGDDKRGWWREKWHNDGAGSILHASLTHYGRRDVACDVGDGSSRTVVIPCEPGTIYFGQMTGPRHQVHHRQCREFELLPDTRGGDADKPKSGGDAFAITVQARTSLFPYNRARQRDTTPNPWCVFEILARELCEGLSRHTFRLPTMAEILAAASASTLASGPTSVSTLSAASVPSAGESEQREAGQAAKKRIRRKGPEYGGA